MTIKRCRHCQRNKCNRPRGLCWSCYYSPTRDLYPVTSKFCQPGIRDYNGRSRLPTPTGALPATVEKVDVMVARAEQGLSLFHPSDAKLSLK